MENILQVENLSKNFEGFSLKNVNFALPKGCIMGLIGENGAGKSTTIKLILNILNKDSGDVQILGEQGIAENDQLKEHIGVVFEEFAFAEQICPSDIDTIMKNTYKTWDSAAFKNYLSKFSLPQKPVKDYSKGMKMKLSIALALSHDSRILILDEPTSGLDPMAREEILDIFLEFIQDENKGVLISSHILSDLEKICDYITCISHGKVLFSEEKDELLSKYAIVKCTKEALSGISDEAIISKSENSYGAQALVKKNALPNGITAEHTTIEDIMINFIRGSAK